MGGGGAVLRSSGPAKRCSKGNVLFSAPSPALLSDCGGSLRTKTSKEQLVCQMPKQQCVSVCVLAFATY